eukprot:PhM_4_TR2404/c1_g1_i1/m.16732
MNPGNRFQFMGDYGQQQHQHLHDDTAQHHQMMSDPNNQQPLAQPQTFQQAQPCFVSSGPDGTLHPVYFVTTTNNTSTTTTSGEHFASYQQPPTTDTTMNVHMMPSGAESFDYVRLVGVQDVSAVPTHRLSASLATPTTPLPHPSTAFSGYGTQPNTPMTIGSSPYMPPTPFEYYAVAVSNNEQTMSHPQHQHQHQQPGAIQVVMLSQQQQQQQQPQNVAYGVMTPPLPQQQQHPSNRRTSVVSTSSSGQPIQPSSGPTVTTAHNDALLAAALHVPPSRSSSEAQQQHHARREAGQRCLYCKRLGHSRKECVELEKKRQRGYCVDWSK